LERMNASIDMARGGKGILSCKIATFPAMKERSYCAVLYSARSPFDLEVGTSSGEHIPPVSRSERRWLRSSSDPWIRFPSSFSAAPIRRNGGFKIEFLPAFLNDNLCENIVVISRMDYMRPASRAKTDLAFKRNLQTDQEAFSRYMKFLRNNRAYLSDFMLSCLLANPAVRLSSHLAENCGFDFK